MNSSQPKSNIFFLPSSLGALPHLWLQAKLTISLSPILDSLARVFMTIAAELWVRGQIGTVDAVFAGVARRFTLRLAEVLANYLSSLMRKAESLATLKQSASSMLPTGCDPYYQNLLAQQWKLVKPIGHGHQVDR